MSVWRLASALTLVLFVGLVVLRSRPGGEPVRYYAPQEYVRRADAFIRHGYLWADCQEEQPRIQERLAAAPAEEKSWYQDSYLSQDVRRFNRDPEGFGWAFVIDDDCRLRGVNPAVHRIELPFFSPIRWLGSIFYHGSGAQAMLRSPERGIALRQAQQPVPARKEATTRVGASAEIDAGGAVLLHFAGGRGQPAARAFHVGGDVVVHNRVRRGQPEEVRLLGHALPVGRLARLETGDWLHLEAERPKRVEETLVYSGATALAPASRMLLENDKYRRATEDPALGLLPVPGDDPAALYLDLVAGGIDAALAAFPEKRGRELAQGFDVQLTLERQVQVRLSQAFRAAILGLQVQHPGKPISAGMTVIDGKTGDVLALATYPWPEDLARLGAMDEDERWRFLFNQNMRLHPIGSAGKPFLFAAIAHAHPFLLDLTIDPYEANLNQREVLECELPKGYRVPAGSGGPVDFRTALQISSNRYAVELATLALAADAGRDAGPLGSRLPADPQVHWPRPGRPSGIRIASQELDYAPDLGEYVFAEEGEPENPDSPAVERCASLDRFEYVRFRVPFEILTGAATYWGTAPQNLPQNINRAYRTNRYDLRLFAPLLAHLFPETDEEQRWRIRAAAQAMSPERVNLSFNQVSRLREDFVTLVLGGGTSLWTNVQLAESLSRLVTGRAVEARLVRRILPRKDGKTPVPEEDLLPPLAAEFPIRPEARLAVLEGLARVGRPGGTAVTLQGRTMEAALDRDVRPLFPAQRVDLYSKTGSPVLEFPVSRRTAQALERLVGRSRLRVEGRTLFIRPKGEEVPYAAPGTSGRQPFRSALARALTEVGFPHPSARLVSYMADLLDDLADDLNVASSGESSSTDNDGPIAIEAGAVRLNRDHRLFRQGLIPGKGAVYLFSLVRRPANASQIPRPADLADPSLKVITVVIFLSIGPDSHVAVDVAQKVLPEIAWLLR